MRILIVDDSELVRRGVKALISSEKTWEVCGEAGDGREGIQKARELQPDLVLLDLSMPDVNGLQVARYLRQDLRTTKILIMSQNDPLELLPPAIAAGADGVIDKSRIGTDLLAAIKNIEVEQRANRVAG
jgi:two-component system, NarL family, nitrate/nitrite response regulator NarL